MWSTYPIDQPVLVLRSVIGVKQASRAVGSALLLLIGLVYVFAIVMFTLLITIVLFNAVIAIMGEKYAEVVEEQQERRVWSHCLSKM